MQTSDAPWLRFYGDVPATLHYPPVTVYEDVIATVRRVPERPAVEFLGAVTTYAELGRTIDRMADALASLGLGRGDRLTISMPTSPQGVAAFYAAARLGAVAAMIHPLSTPVEVERYLRLSGSRIALTLDVLHDRFAGQELDALVLTSVADCLPAPKRLAYRATRGLRTPRVPVDARVRRWRELAASAHPSAAAPPAAADEPAAILFSGGTTGEPKAAMLSHRSFTAQARQLVAWARVDESDVVLALLPIFHGFGLGALVHTGLTAGAKVVLVPQFTPETVARLLAVKRITLTAGVPTLFDAIARSPALERADLSALRAAFCGADILPPHVQERFERLVHRRGGTVRLLEGYGLTEATAGVTAMPLGEQRPGSIGIPLPDTLASICRPGTIEQLPPNEEGEICISGPTVMLGYLDDPAATAAALRRHDDGRIWLHTGDAGRRDDDGFFFFTGRLKRMIKSSGFNVFPAQVEAVLLEHPAVRSACVVGVPDEAQGERVKAFVALVDPAAAGPALADELVEHCREHLIKWSCPRDVEFLAELPTTRLGKIDYRMLARASS